MTKHFCDLCGKEIAIEGPYFVDFKMRGAIFKMHFEVCQSCYDRLYETALELKGGE